MPLSPSRVRHLRLPDDSGLPMIRTWHLPAILLLVIVSACVAGQPAVVQKLDEMSAVTLTYGATPMVMSLDTPYGQSDDRRYLQVGSFEVNRMGGRTYFLWLGISGLESSAAAGSNAEAFASVTLLLENQSIDLDVVGWSHASLGIGEPIYKKLYANSIDAYYPITLEQIQLLANSSNPKLRTSGSAPMEYVPWYEQALFKRDLDEFLRTVM